MEEGTTGTCTSTSHTPIIVDGIDVTLPHKDWIGKCSQTPKRRNATFWRGFHIADDERNGMGKLYVVCNVCGQILISHNSGTTNLRRHMKANHESVFDKLLEIQKTEKEDEGNSHQKRSAPNSHSRPGKPKKVKVKNTCMPIERAEILQAIYCIATNLPFHILDQPDLHSFVQTCVDIGRGGGSFVPSSTVARTKTTEFVEIVRSIVMDEIQEAKTLVLSIDFWETSDKLNLVYVGIRWIADFTLHYCFLSRKTYQGTAHMKQLLVGVHEDLNHLKIPIDRISHVVSNWDMSKEEFPDNFDAEVIHSLDYGLERVVNQSLNPRFGCAETGSDATLKELEDVLNKARVLVKSLESSKMAIVEEHVNRWWSTLGMMESLIENEGAIQASTIGKESDSNLSLDEWEMLKCWKEALQPFSQAIKTLSDNPNCTSSLVPFIQYVVCSELSKTMKGETSLKLGHLINTLLKRFEREFGKTVSLTQSGFELSFFLAHALDPRFKQLKILSSEDDKEQIWNILLEKMLELEPTTAQSSLEGRIEPTDFQAISQSRDVVVSDSHRDRPSTVNIFDQYAGVLQSSPAKDETTWKLKCINELQLYRAESTVGLRTENGKEDPLSWWRTHHVVFPTLWQLAQVYLTIPATSSSPRMAFNIHESAMAMTRVVSFDNFPPGSDFLYENSWVLDKYF